MPTKVPVLIVEDVDEMRLMIEQVVNSLPGFRVSGSSANCSEARLELTRRRPSVVLLDEILPGESRTELLAELVAEGIPVVLMTGVENATHPFPEGAKMRIVKPDWSRLEDDSARVAEALSSAIASK